MNLLFIYFYGILFLKDMRKDWPVVGQDKIKRLLQGAILRQRVDPVYLFFGKKYLGKEVLAKSFIRALLCQKKDGFFCRACSGCLQWEKGIYPDFHEIDLEEGKKYISVGQIRDVLNKISKSSFSGNKKIVLLKNSSFLSEEAANALLKPLEEPPASTFFILLADTLDRIPKTIQSRVSLFHLFPSSIENIKNYLEKKNIGKEEAKELAHLCAGRPFLAEKFFNNSSLLSNYKRLTTSLLSFFRPALGKQFNYLESSLKKGNTFNQKTIIANNIIDGWLVLLRDLLLLKTGAYKEMNNLFLKQKLLALERDISFDRLIAIIDSLNKAKKLLESNVNPQLLLENLILIF